MRWLISIFIFFVVDVDLQIIARGTSGMTGKHRVRAVTIRRH